ncbi:MAG: hypothetical protein AB8I08_29045 [Sandaracinaceae bacterium]
MSVSRPLCVWIALVSGWGCAVPQSTRETVAPRPDSVPVLESGLEVEPTPASPTVTSEAMGTDGQGRPVFALEIAGLPAIDDDGRVVYLDEVEYGPRRLMAWTAGAETGAVLLELEPTVDRSAQVEAELAGLHSMRFLGACRDGESINPAAPVRCTTGDDVVPMDEARGLVLVTPAAVEVRLAPVRRIELAARRSLAGDPPDCMPRDAVASPPMYVEVWAEEARGVVLVRARYTAYAHGCELPDAYILSRGEPGLLLSPP